MRDWLRSIREQYSLTQEEMAHLCGISRSYYTHLENGTKTPAPELAKRIATSFRFEWTKFF